MTNNIPFPTFGFKRFVLSIKRSTFTSSKFQRMYLITFELRLNPIKTIKSVKMCSVTAKVNGQRLESCEHLTAQSQYMSTWLLGMMEVVTWPGTMFTPGHDGATMFTETWRHAPGHCSVQPSVTA